MKTFRWLAVLAALILIAPTLAPSSADARAGGGTNSGSRGTRTNQPPAPTQTAPSAAPIQRSVTPSQPATSPAATTAQATPQTGGFLARHPFLSGMMGGLFGAGLFGMLFGGGFGGGAGILGLLFQVLLIGGLGYLAVRLFRGRSASASLPARPAYAYATASPAVTDVPIARSSVPQTGGAPLLAGGVSLGTAGNGQLTIAAEDYNDFERLLGAVQTAYSDGDLARLRGLATPEMVGYFSEQLSANASRGVENKIDRIKLEQGDLAEAWREGGIDYATVGMRFSLIDVTRRIADGAIVEGNSQVPTEATEIWTFLRSRGGKWIVSAIQQAQRHPAMSGAVS